MILIVILVHAIAANEMEIRVMLLDFVTNRRYVLSIMVIVNWIGFLLSDNTAVDDIPFLCQTDLHQLFFRQLNQVRVRRLPESIVLKTEVFEAVTSFVRVRHHLGRPGPEVLDPSNLDAGIVDIDPVVIEHVSFL